MLIGCTVELKPALEKPPLFSPIEARVGFCMSAPVQSYSYVDPLVKVDVGNISVSHFEQVFKSMFSETAALPVWPPWRESKPHFDGVIELCEMQFDLEMGDDLENPDVVSVSYRVCLYQPDGSAINCWDTSETQAHQRRPFECLDLSRCLTPQIETAIRGAIAKFMFDFEDDPLVGNWAKNLSRKNEVP
jgi:hypothetical protein